MMQQLHIAAAPHTRSRRSSVAAGGSTILALSVRVFVIRSRGAARVSRTLVVVSVSPRDTERERNAALLRPSVHQREGLSLGRGENNAAPSLSPHPLSLSHSRLCKSNLSVADCCARARVLSLFALGRTRKNDTTTAEAGPPGTLMILPQVHLRKPCYDFYFL